MQIFSSVAQIRIHNINADIFVYMRPACKLPFVFRFSYHRLQHWIRGERRKHFELGEKVVKTKSLIILVLRTWFILPFSSWTTEPGTSSPRWVPDSFCLHSSAWTTDPASQLPSSWPAPHSAVSGQICLALSMICEFPVHEPTCQIKPTPAPSRRAARIWKVPHSDLVTSLVDTHLLAGGSFSPGRSEGSSPLPKPCLLSVL